MSDTHDKAVEAMAKAIAFGDPEITPLGHQMLVWPNDWSPREADEHRDLARCALHALLTAYPHLTRAMEPGMVVVPREPTEAMLDAGGEAWLANMLHLPVALHAAYTTMIAAAPEPKS